MCTLCGTHWNLEWRPSEQVFTQVSERYKEGPFAWAALRDTKELESPFCAHCLNHIRKRKRHGKGQMLPMDLFLLGFLNPQFCTKVDQRSYKRLARVITQPNNKFTKLNIAPLEKLIHDKKWLQTWWEINLKTPFFWDRVTARMVRQGIKEHNK